MHHDFLIAPNINVLLYKRAFLPLINLFSGLVTLIYLMSAAPLMPHHFLLSGWLHDLTKTMMYRAVSGANTVLGAREE